jgi:hypothetical protein
MRTELRHWTVTAAAIALGMAWIVAGILIASAYGITDSPKAPTWSVMVVAWLPIPMALAAVADIGLREFGRRPQRGTVPRAVGASLLLWAVAVLACLLS